MKNTMDSPRNILTSSHFQVFKLGLAKSIHHARVLIRQRHIRVRKQVCETVPEAEAFSPDSANLIKSDVLTRKLSKSMS